jgi:hypothetical protein
LIESVNGDEIVSTDNALENVDFSFDKVRLRTEVDGDIARVTVADGYLSVRSVSGERGELELPEDVEDEFRNSQAPPLNVVMVKESGTWYISITRTAGEFFLETMESENRAGNL